MTFEAFFQQATGNPPLPYQTALALSAALPDQLSVPTGLGKTAAGVSGFIPLQRLPSQRRARR